MRKEKIELALYIICIIILALFALTEFCEGADIYRIDKREFTEFEQRIINDSFDLWNKVLEEDKFIEADRLTPARDIKLDIVRRSSSVYKQLDANKFLSKRFRSEAAYFPLREELGRHFDLIVFKRKICINIASHEIGHYLGLTHISDKGLLMNPRHRHNWSKCIIGPHKRDLIK